MLGLGNKVSKTGLVNPVVSHVTDNLKMLHRYNTGSVVSISDGAIYFDGENSYAATTSTETLNDDISVSMWTKPMFDNSTSDIKTLFNFGQQSTTDGFLWLYIQNDDVRIQYCPAGAGDYSYWRWDDMHESSDYYKWTHWGFVYDKSETRPVTVYKNGVSLGLADSEAHGGSGADNGAGTNITSELWTIGSYIANLHQYTGYICNVGVWNSALTGPQIKNIMFSDYEDAKEKLGNPVHWWACDEQSGTTLVDQGSNALNLTVTGT